MIVHLGLFELRLMLRRRITAFSVIVLPVGLCALTWLNSQGMPAGQWGSLVGSMFLLLLLSSVFLVGTNVYTGRRQSLVLQRLRTTELTDFGVLAGVTAPIFVVGLAQALVYFGFCLAIGAPMPAQPLMVIAGVLTGLLTAVVASAATAAFSRSIEATQVTALPVIGVGMTGLFMMASGDSTVATIGAALPFAGPTELVVRGWSGDSSISAVVAGLSMVGWVVVFAVLVARYFRWEPRQ